MENGKWPTWATRTLKKAKSGILRDCGISLLSSIDAAVHTSFASKIRPSGSSELERPGTSGSQELSGDDVIIPATEEVIFRSTLSGSSPAVSLRHEPMSQSSRQRRSTHSNLAPIRASELPHTDTKFSQICSSIRKKTRSRNKLELNQDTESSLFYVDGSGSDTRLKPAALPSIDVEFPDACMDLKFTEKPVVMRPGNSEVNDQSGFEAAEVHNGNSSDAIQPSTACLSHPTQTLSVAARFDMIKDRQKEHWSSVSLDDQQLEGENATNETSRQ